MNCGFESLRLGSFSHSLRRRNTGKMEKKPERILYSSHLLYLPPFTTNTENRSARSNSLSSWITRSVWCPGQRRKFRALPCPDLACLPTVPACLPACPPCRSAAVPPRRPAMMIKPRWGDNEKNATRHQFSFIRVWIEIRSEIGIIPMGGNGDGGDDDGPVYHPPLARPKQVWPVDCDSDSAGGVP